MSTNLPIRSLRPLHRQFFAVTPSKRFLSSTPALQKGRTAKRRPVDPVVVTAHVRRQPGKAQSSQQQEQLSDERNVPDDIGLIPGTFIHAPLLPFTRFPLKERMGYEWKWLKGRVTAWYQLWRFRRTFTDELPHMLWFMLSPRSFNKRKSLKEEAIQKYKQLYDAFARADNQEISRVCASGVASEFQKRIESRFPGVEMQWKLEGEPNCRIVSNVASPLELPGYEETGIHQVTLRIQSKQTVQLPESTVTSDIVEYVVMQQLWVRGSAKGWKIWGFADFSTPKSLEEAEEYARNLNAYQTASS